MGPQQGAVGWSMTALSGLSGVVAQAEDGVTGVIGVDGMDIEFLLVSCTDEPPTTSSLHL